MGMCYQVIPRTLCFVLHGNDVLLIKRSRHKRLFPNKINGLGGHVEHGEDVETAVIREIMEEAHVSITDLWLAGVVNVDVSSNNNTGVMLFVFTAQATGRNVRSSEEGEVLWVPLTAVSGLDWVGGKPDLLEQALSAKGRKRPFFTHKLGTETDKRNRADFDAFLTSVPDVEPVEDDRLEK